MKKKKRKTRNKTRNIVLLLLLTVGITAAGIAIYINDFYPAEAEAIQCLSQPEEEVQITRHGENYIFAPKDPTTGIHLGETGSLESDRISDQRPEYTPQETYDDSFFGKPAQQLYEEVFSVTDQKTEYVHYYVTDGTLYLDEYAETGEQDEEGLFLYEWNRGKWIADNVIAVDYNWYRMQPDALYITSDHVLHGTGKYSGITLENVRYASVYADQMLALTLDGSLWCRGKLYSIATGHTLEYQGWALVMEDVAYAQLAHYRYMAITGDGSLYMWGDNAYGQFGDGSLLTDGSGSDLEAAFYSEPVKVADGIKMVWEGYPGRPKQTEEIGECRTYFLTEQDELFVCGQGIGDETRSFSYFGELGTLEEPLQVLCTNQLHRVK